MIHNFELIRRKRKSVTLTINNAKLYVYAPLRLSRAYIDEFVKSKADWIEKKIKQQNEKRQRFYELLSYESILIFGKKYKLQFISAHKKITLDEDVLHIPQKLYSPDSTQNIALKKAIISWMKKKAIEYLPAQLHMHSTALGVSFSSFSLTNAKTKWGSCDNKSKIRINWRLIMLEKPLIDYVLIHELCHILVPNHSKFFWQKVGEFVPQYKALRKQLKECSVVNELLR